MKPDAENAMWFAVGLLLLLGVAVFAIRWILGECTEGWLALQQMRQRTGRDRQEPPWYVRLYYWMQA